MPERVQKVALVLAFIGFLPFAIAGNIPAAIMSASICVAIVYFGFLLAYGIREVIRRDTRPPDDASS
jgi:xanthine/uracil permease